VATAGAEGDRLQIPVALGGPEFEAWAAAARQEGFAVRDEEPVRQGCALLLSLESGDKQPCLALFHDPLKTVEDFTATAASLLTATDVALNYLRNRQLQQSLADVENCVQTLDTLAIINGQTRFYAMAMALCNEVRDRFRCSRVSLGAYKEPYVRVKAISNMDRFEKKMDVVQRLEAAMEEAVDQDEDILYPPDDQNTAITRDHQAYAAAEGAPFILTLPVRLSGKIVGVLCFERDERTFDEQEIRAFRVLADQTARRITDLQARDRWFGARMASSLREFFGGFLGYERTWRKLFAILGLVTVAVLVFVRVNYRVEAPMILRSSELTHISAPFPGFIEAANVRVGDLVSEGDVLIRLDTSELLVQRANHLAEMQRFRSQAENAEAERRLSDMRVALAQLRQSEAALQLTDFRLERALMRAPFDGVVVEGDLTERIGAPVEKGDTLIRLTRLSDLYVEMRVDERDINDIQKTTDGEFAFTSKPDEKFAFMLERIEPVAIAEAEGSVFHVRGTLASDIQEWWRPGMSGVAKLNTEPRSLLWIFTHRLIDFLRLQLWW
jgi:multidrug resistance efflux pump